MRRIALVCLGLLLFSSLQAQELTLNPYSRYGLGDIFNISTSRNAAMGGIGIATDNYFSINRINPASFADATFTTFDISGFGHLSRFNTGNSTEEQGSAGFQNISFMFPANNNFSLAFGFSPYSVVGYNATVTNTINISGVEQTEIIEYEASGGINQLFIGGAFKMLDRKLRIGGNLLYSFGGARYGRQAAVQDFAAAGTRSVTLDDQAFITGVGAQLGVLYADTISAKGVQLRVGAIAEFNGNLSGTRLLTSDNQFALDTLINEEGNVEIPFKYGVGFTLSKPLKWTIGADLTLQDWEQFSYFSDTYQLSRELRLGVGGEWTPEFTSFKYLKRISYRLGGYYKQSYIAFGDQTVNDIGFTFGFGLPAGQAGTNQFNRSRLYSKVHLGAAVGRRGNLTDGQPLEELYIRIRVGFTLTDTWFIKRVVD